jgi:hypothetical protein
VVAVAGWTGTVLAIKLAIADRAIAVAGRKLIAELLLATFTVGEKIFLYFLNFDRYFQVDIITYS